MEDGQKDQRQDRLARLASFPEQNPDPVIETDLEGGITYLNPVARERFPDMEMRGLEHPMLMGLPEIARRIEDEDSHSREVQVGYFVYEQKLSCIPQHQEFERVGGNKTIEVDIRVIAATHPHLEEMVQEGTFREDLFYRLNVFPVRLPPLRQRPEDLPLLANYFAYRVCGRLGRPACQFSEGAMERLVDYPWPGNVRELENIVERAVILCGGETIDQQHVHVDTPSTPPALGHVRPLQEMEREHIRAALQASGGKISGAGSAAEMLGLKPSTLESRMKKLGVRREDV